MTNVVYNIDCVKYMETVNDETFDLTVTSPPYDNIRDYNGYLFDYKKTIEQLYRVTKRGGVVVWIVSDQTVDGSETLTSFKQCLYAKECGFNVHDTMIWEKESCAFPEAVRYYPVFEYMFVWSKGKPKTFNPIQDRLNKTSNSRITGTERQRDGTVKRSNGSKIGSTVKQYGFRFNVWNIISEKNNKTGHPAVFPLSLAKDHIRSWSNKNDIVFDPFLGSGTTRIAAHDLYRQFVGCEIDKTYFEKQEERFKKHTAQLRLDF